MRPPNAASAAADRLPPPRPPQSTCRITGPSNLRPGDVVVRHAQELTVTRVVRNLDDTVVHYRDHPPDTFGIGSTVMRRRPSR